jgi:hypothetical protein
MVEVLREGTSTNFMKTRHIVCVHSDRRPLNRAGPVDAVIETPITSKGEGTAGNRRRTLEDLRTFGHEGRPRRPLPSSRAV